MKLEALASAALVGALSACGDGGGEVPPTPAPAPESYALPSEAELLERARREIPPGRFGPEFERLRREILGPDRKSGRQ